MDSIANLEKERTAILIAVNEMVLTDLKQTINRVPDNLVPLLEQYAFLSLTGGLSVQMESAVKFLEQKYIAMEKTFVGQYKLEKVKKSLDQMKRELELLNNTQGNRQQESVGIETMFYSSISQNVTEQASNHLCDIVK